MTIQAIPLSLYIHLPWCVKKCPYCDFNSHALRSDLPEMAYVVALLDDFDQAAPMLSQRPLVSIFFGGGTPSLFSAAALRRLLEELAKRVTFSPSIEITLEANPGTVDTARFSGFREAGINRLSVGIQSLQDDKLQRLGRIHGRQEALNAITAVKDAGFDNFNLDIMHGLPEQSVTDALSDLQDALATRPTHLSWYQLTLEPNTLFHAKPPTLPEEDTLHRIQAEGEALLRAHGLQNYEVSAWTRPGQACRHNLNYWMFGDYLGIGAGAHSKLTDLKSGSTLRRAQCKHPTDYLTTEKRRATPWQKVSTRDIAFEFMLNALRLTDGVPTTLFEKRTQLPLAMISEPLQQAREKKLLLPNEDILCATPLGRQFLNNLTELFLPT